VRGTLDADDVKGVRQALQAPGGVPRHATPLAKAGAREVPIKARREAPRPLTGRSLAERAPGSRSSTSACKRLATNQGQRGGALHAAARDPGEGRHPPGRLAHALIEQIESEDLRDAYSDVRNKVNEGTSFATALSQHPALFPGLYVNMVAAGEASGTMEAVLARLADFMEGQVKLKNKIVGALAYPAFMALMGVGDRRDDDGGGGAEGERDLRRLPRLAALVHLGAHLGLELRGQLLVAHRARRGRRGVPLRALAALDPEGRYKWDAIQLALPVFGELTRMVAISRFTRTLATLLASGVPLLKAMDIVKNVMENKRARGGDHRGHGEHQGGREHRRAAQAQRALPPIVTQMISIGERSGELESMLEAVAASYDSAIDAASPCSPRCSSPS
jgi:general secretion pathway protein F